MKKQILMIGFLALLSCLVSVLPVQASSKTLEVKKIGSFKNGHVANLFKLGDSPAYCVQYNIPLPNGPHAFVYTPFTGTDNKSYQYSWIQQYTQETPTLCQALMWVAESNKVKLDSKNYPNFGLSMDEAVKTYIDTESEDFKTYKKFKRNLQNIKVLPSFASKTQAGAINHPIKLYWNKESNCYEAYIGDENAVLSYFKDFAIQYATILYKNGYLIIQVSKEDADRFRAPVVSSVSYSNQYDYKAKSFKIPKIKYYHWIDENGDGTIKGTVKLKDGSLDRQDMIIAEDMRFLDPFPAYIAIQCVDIPSSNASVKVDSKLIDKDNSTNNSVIVPGHTYQVKDTFRYDCEQTPSVLKEVAAQEDIKSYPWDARNDIDGKTTCIDTLSDISPKDITKKDSYIVKKVDVENDKTQVTLKGSYTTYTYEINQTNQHKKDYTVTLEMPLNGQADKDDVNIINKSGCNDVSINIGKQGDSFYYEFAVTTPEFLAVTPKLDHTAGVVVKGQSNEARFYPEETYRYDNGNGEQSFGRKFKMVKTNNVSSNLTLQKSWNYNTDYNFAIKNMRVSHGKQDAIAYDKDIVLYNLYYNIIWKKGDTTIISKKNEGSVTVKTIPESNVSSVYQGFETDIFAEIKIGDTGSIYLQDHINDNVNETQHVLPVRIKRNDEMTIDTENFNVQVSINYPLNNNESLTNTMPRYQEKDITDNVCKKTISYHKALSSQYMPTEINSSNGSFRLSNNLIYNETRNSYNISKLPYQLKWKTVDGDKFLEPKNKSVISKNDNSMPKESYKITKIEFSSPTTKTLTDKTGKILYADGWVDMESDNSNCIIAAGEAYQIRITTTYKNENVIFDYKGIYDEWGTNGANIYNRQCYFNNNSDSVDNNLIGEEDYRFTIPAIQDIYMNIDGNNEVYSSTGVAGSQLLFQKDSKINHNASVQELTVTNTYTMENTLGSNYNLKNGDYNLTVWIPLSNKCDYIIEGGNTEGITFLGDAKEVKYHVVDSNYHKGTAHLVQ